MKSSALMQTNLRLVVPLIVVLLLATAAGLYFTSEWHAAGPRKAAAAAEALATVDLSLMRTAQELSRLSVSPEEQELAKEALRLADHDTDVAFAAALRDAADHPIVPNPQQREIQARLQRAQKLVESDKKEIARLTPLVEKAEGDKKDELELALQIARAEEELDQEEVNDAGQELIRAGGDPQARIQRMVDEHEAAGHSAGQTGAATPPPLFTKGLAGRIQEYERLGQRSSRIVAAQSEAHASATALVKRHEALERLDKTDRANSPELVLDDGFSGPASQSPALLESARRMAARQKQMASLNKRILDENQLAGVYGRWNEIVLGNQRGALHRMLLDVLWILLTVLAVVFLGRWGERFFARLTPDRRRLLTMRTVTRAAAQSLGVCVVLLLIFGPPEQLATVLGLAGAGLTVALKDFISGFLGWFVLMGKNGIRVGDWVEIRGVGGEVVEIGIFHTVLLETGNWTDSGHPTGRRVTFVNSFAVEGHYFNFSTSGQWLWDELRLTVPPGHDPHPIVEAIQKKVAEDTAEDAHRAEQEWQRVAQTHGMSAFSAEPAISLRPGPAGIDIVVRYITSANQRHQVRSKLYRDAVSLLSPAGVRAG